jgi:hypothetical protein
VERWRSHCGCSDGGHPDWIQEWRRPLRRGLNYLKYYVDEHFFRTGSRLFRTPGEALTDYGLVLAGTRSPRDFLTDHLHEGLLQDKGDTGLKLLAMQRWALASFASCAWFFDDIGRIEPVNAMTFALRALALHRETGGPDIEGGLMDILDEAESNVPHKGTGKEIWHRDVLPRKADPLHLAAMQILSGWPDPPGDGQSAGRNTPEITFSDQATGPDNALRGSVRWHIPLDGESGREPFTVPAAPSLPRAEVRFESGATVSLRDLDRRKQREVLHRGAEQREATLWRVLVDQAATLGETFLDFEEGQNVPQSRTGALLPGLLWVWLREEVHLDRDDLDAMAAIVRDNPALSAMLETRVAAEVNTLLRTSSPDWPRLARILGRTNLLGLHPDWWTAQNLLWEMDRDTVNREVARLLSVKV